MSLNKTEGIILSKKNFRESDRIFLIYGQNEGKLEVLAKGARKKTSKLAGLLEPYAWVAVTYARGRGFDYVTAVKVLKNYPFLGQNILINSWFSLLVEIIVKHVKPRFKEKEIFDLLKNLLAILDKKNDNQLKKISLILAAVFRLLKILGFAPELYACQICRAKLTPGENRFSAASAGLLCSKCGARENNSLIVSSATIKIMRFFLDNNWEKILVLKIKKDNLLEMIKVVYLYLPYILEDEFKSLKFIKKVEATQSCDFLL